MTDAERLLLDQYGVVALPETLDHDAYLMVLAACLMRPDKPISLYCRGNGGSCRAANAIVDLAREHGQVRGVLLGEANSSHAVIFAGCPQRYTYPNASIGLHRTGIEFLEHVDAPYAMNRQEDLDTADRYNASILAAACDSPTWNEAYWYDIIDHAGSRGLSFFNASTLIERGMAKPISEMPR